MITFRFPTAAGNDILRSGKIDKVLQQAMEDLKPEAAYFYPVNGDRGGHFIVNMTESTDVLRFGERIWFGLNAQIEMTPVMGAEDIQKGMGELPGIIERYG